MPVFSADPLDDNFELNGISIKNIENFRDWFLLAYGPKSKIFFPEKRSAYHQGLLDSLEKEINENINFLIKKENSSDLIANYFKTLETYLKFLNNHYSDDNLHFKYRMETDGEDSTIILDQKFYINEAILLIDQIKAEQFLRSVEKAKVLHIKSEYSISERVLIIRCFQENGLFFKENQETLQKDIINLLSALFGLDYESIKTAYQKSNDYLTGTKLTKDQKKHVINSLKKIRPVLEHTKNPKLLKMIDKRIHEFELSF